MGRASHTSRESRLPKCPLCVRWHCLDCGKQTNETDKRNLFGRTKACTRCDSVNGEYRPVIHYDRDKHDAHVRKAELEMAVKPVPQGRVNDVAALLGLLDPHLKLYRSMVRRNLATATGSYENNAVVNIGNEALLRIDSTIREWIKKHPD